MRRRIKKEDAETTANSIFKVLEIGFEKTKLKQEIRERAVMRVSKISKV
ncbi:MAG: hypothetical protein QXJ96_03250 [Candidatus Aenigmatarchaeota archaeon]